MYLRISRSLGGEFDFWFRWGWGSPQEGAFNYPLEEGAGFLDKQNLYFDAPEESTYDPARCGAFADWLEENQERLLEGFSDSDRPLAAERLQALCQWLRSGFQPKE